MHEIKTKTSCIKTYRIIIKFTNKIKKNLQQKISRKEEVRLLTDKIARTGCMKLTKQIGEKTKKKETMQVKKNS